MATSEEPKKPQNAYWLFLSENREKFEKEVPQGTKKGPGTAKVAGDAWKSLSDQARKPYDDKAAKLKAEYDKAMEKFLASGGEKSKRKMQAKDSDAKRAKKEKDPNKPKRPQNAYWLFLTDHRAQFEKQIPPGTKKGPGTAKVAGEAWKKLSDKERQPYAAQAEKLRKEFDQQMAKYKAEKAAAGEEVDDDEEDEDANADLGGA